MDAFEKHMTEQKDRARASSSNKSLMPKTFLDALAKMDKTKFEYVEKLIPIESKIVGLFDINYNSVNELKTGELGYMAVNTTPFYAESGGQVGDTGELSWIDGLGKVTDTQAPVADRRLHHIKLQNGVLKDQEVVKLTVDSNRRQRIMANHSATHLLHAALRDYLGKHVTQAGSMVSPELLRFDFTHPNALSNDDLLHLEQMVNSWIKKNAPTQTSIVDIEGAKAEGAMALFGEKYGEEVRMVRFGDQSVELCGGTHVNQTADIRFMMITSERGVAAGIRRIEAVAGDGALELVNLQREQLIQASQKAGVPQEQVPDLIEKQTNQIKTLKKEVDQLKMAMASGSKSSNEMKEINGINVITKEVMDIKGGALRQLADELKDQVGSGVVILGLKEAKKATLLVSVTSNVAQKLSASDIVKYASTAIEGGGGGKPEMAQAGGKKPDGMEQAFELALDFVRNNFNSGN